MGACFRPWEFGVPELICTGLTWSSDKRWPQEWGKPCKEFGVETPSAVFQRALPAGDGSMSSDSVEVSRGLP